MLPFPKKGLGHYEDLVNPALIAQRVQALGKRDEFDIILIDSLTLWGEQLEAKLAATYNKKDGYALYADYNKQVVELMSAITTCPKMIILTAIAEVIDVGTLTAQGVVTTSQQFVAAVQGQKKRGRIEANFTIVLMSQSTGGKYVFETNNGHNTTSKTPMGMFKEKTIDNDARVVLERAINFFDLPLKVERKSEETNTTKEKK